MSYTPTVWVNGDTITATKLNKMENGIAEGGGGGGALFVADEEGTLDKTWQEMWDAAETSPVIVTLTSETEISHYYVVSVITDEESFYGVRTHDQTLYETSSASGYPVLSE